MHLNTNGHEGEEKNNGVHLKIASGSDSALRLKPDASVFHKLLAASKDAEVLIACLFEQQLITAEPLQQIWDRLAAAINEAQHTLQAEHRAGLSAPSSRRYRGRRL